MLSALAMMSAVPWKEKLAFVALDYDDEMEKSTANDRSEIEKAAYEAVMNAAYELPGKIVTFSHHHPTHNIRCPPNLHGVPLMSD